MEPRIVSLIASSTEIVCALGFGERLVGRSHECDTPGWVQRLPALSRPKIDIHAAPGEVDRSVRALLAKALSVYEVDPERLRALAPTHVITQDHCRVCAVSLPDVERALCEWVKPSSTGEPPPTIVSLEPNALADVWGGIRAIAAALDAPERGERLVLELSGRMEKIQARALVSQDKPTFACIEWIEPLMTAGNWMPELVAMAGGMSLFGVVGKHSPYLSWEEVVRADPEVLFVSPCGYGVEKTRSEMAALTSRPGWGGLRAVRKGRVVLADGNRYFHRPGPRLVESLEILAEILHPELFRFGHEGDGWVRWLSDPVATAR